MSTREVADAIGINRSTLVRIEGGLVSVPAPRILDALARVLDLNQVELYGLVGWVPSDGLPAFTPYLRNKFVGMPEEARAELEQSFRRIADKYGYDATGPQAGEDEH